MQQSKIERVGGFLVILALASVFAWFLGRRFPLTEYQPWTAIVIAAIGFVVILVGVHEERAATGRGVRAVRPDGSAESVATGGGSSASNFPSTDKTRSPSDEHPG